MGQLPLDLGFRPALGRVDFLVASCNEAAVAWLDRWPAWGATALVLSGPPGSGKTHLGEVWRARSGAVAIAPDALTSASLPSLLGAASAVFLDDAERADEEALLHLFNLLAERHGHLLLASRESPARWATRLADLRSRLVASPTVAVAAPDDGLMGALLVKLFADRQLAVGEEVIAYLLVQLDRSFEAACETVAALDRAALAGNRAVTVPLARSVLSARPRRDPD
jgi:chromosomal replication initiation ATPase DnaA